MIAAGRTRSGCTVHLVTEEVDSGPIVVQEEVEVSPDDSPESLKAKVGLQWKPNLTLSLITPWSQHASLLSFPHRFLYIYLIYLCVPLLSFLSYEEMIKRRCIGDGPVGCRKRTRWAKHHLPVAFPFPRGILCVGCRSSRGAASWLGVEAVTCGCT